jgi:hypothetical protein
MFLKGRLDVQQGHCYLHVYYLYKEQLQHKTFK